MMPGHSLWAAIGQTPLLKIESLSAMTGCEIFAKAEFMNPGGSIKDRAARAMLADFEARGLLHKGATIVEGTAGNTGIGLAMLAAERGYRCIISMPDNQAREKYELLRALGAELRLVPAVPFKDKAHFYHRAQEIAAEIPGAVWADQFENPANARCHYLETGPEILAQMDGRIDILTLACGTGGTIGGVSKALKEVLPDLEVVLADPLGSGLYQYIQSGEITSVGSSVSEGIGIMRLTANFKQAQIDSAIRIDDAAMLGMLQHLARHDGLVVGSSAGINVAAAYALARQHQGSGKRIVTFICDHGSRYFSRLYDQTWLQEKGLVARLP